MTGKISKAMLAINVASFALLATPAFAQKAEPQQSEAENVEAIVVTGTSIRGVAPVGAPALYRGPQDSRGRRLYFGRPVGSELLWGGPEVATYSAAFVRNMSEDAPRDFDLVSFGFEPKDLARYNGLASIYNAGDPDISTFQKHGGKLILWHGLADPGVPAGSTVSYYRDVRKTLGESVDSFVKMYLLPGVGHCGGGNGPEKMNMVDAMMAWVEDGVAPRPIETVKMEYGRVMASRPVYPYPALATYRGSGEPTSAASFISSKAE